MAIAEIEFWLKSSRDYSQGRALYFKYGSDQRFIEQLKLPENSFLRKKLVQQIRGLSEASKTVFEPEPKSVPKFIAPPNKKSKVDESQLSDWTTERNNLRKRKWAELNEFKNLLSIDNTAESIKQNKKLINNIKTLYKEINSLWKELDYYQRTGEELLQRHEVDLPLHHLQKVLTNTRTYVSKFKGVPGKEHLFRKHKKEVARLEKLLNESI